MSTAERDLWPGDIFVQTEGFRPPLQILREQASLLGEKTKNLLEAKVVTNTEPVWFTSNDLPSKSHALERENDAFVHAFNLVAPALNNYKYQLFRIVHPIEGYPLKVYFSDSEALVDSEDQLIDQLKFIFADEKTKRVIQSLISQSRS